MQLILETAGGQAASGVVDAYPRPVERKQIVLRHQKANDLLGLNLKPEEIEYYLGQLGLKTTHRKARSVGEDSPVEPATFEIPTFRPDLKREVDLIEEVARLHGVDKIPATPPRGTIGANDYDSVHDQIAEARRILSGTRVERGAGSNTDFEDGSPRHERPDAGGAQQSAEFGYGRVAVQFAARLAACPSA